MDAPPGSLTHESYQKIASICEHGLVIVPVINVFYEALARGAGIYMQNLLADPDTRHAIVLTLTVAPVAVVLNVVFGVAAARAIARYQFPGRTILTTLIDLPFSVSPVV